MDTTLFTFRSLITMFHGIALGGGALLTLFAALFAWRAMSTSAIVSLESDRHARHLAWLMVAAAVLLWLTVIGGTYLVFPPYRAAPPEGLADLSQYPRSLLLSNPGTRWLHAFAMEIKEHVPWMTAMIATAVTAVMLRYRAQALRDAELRRQSLTLIGVCLALVAAAALLGTFVNKVAPLH